MTTALLLIDVQNDYFPSGHMEVEGAEAALHNIRRLLMAFRQRQQPVIHVQHISTRPGAGFFLPETAGVEIHPQVAPGEGEALITKHTPNSFRDTPLEAILQQQSIDSLMVVGMMSHMCIDATVRAAVDNGYACTVVHDACATRALALEGVQVTAPQVHAAYMAALGSVYAQVLPTAAILATLPTPTPRANTSQT